MGKERKGGRKRKRARQPESYRASLTTLKGKERATITIFVLESNISRLPRPPGKCACEGGAGPKEERDNGQTAQRPPCTPGSARHPVWPTRKGVPVKRKPSQISLVFFRTQAPDRRQ